MERIPVAVRVARALRDEIVDGHHNPATRLSEQVLAERLGVSRNSLREAFRILERDGYVIHIPNRGVFIPEVDAEEVEQLYAFRRVAELGAIVEMTPDQMRGFARDLQPMARRIEKAIREDDSVMLGRSNADLHMSIIRYAGSPVLDQAAAAVFVRMQLAMLATGRTLELRMLFSKRNLGIIRALAAGNGLRTRAEVRAYLDASLDDVLDAFGVPRDQRRPHPQLP